MDITSPGMPCHDGVALALGQWLAKGYPVGQPLAWGQASWVWIMAGLGCIHAPFNFHGA